MFMIINLSNRVYFDKKSKYFSLNKVSLILVALNVLIWVNLNTILKCFKLNIIALIFVIINAMIEFDSNKKSLFFSSNKMSLTFVAIDLSICFKLNKKSFDFSLIVILFVTWNSSIWFDSKKKIVEFFVKRDFFIYELFDLKIWFTRMKFQLDNELVLELDRESFMKSRNFREKTCFWLCIFSN